ncbi:unnamed protein product [Orchesella dallaii]|uniref:Uncharacterized protein n=1 Tax=Orchesella dallaii TaxID=48710 RepID=A0ABP1S8F5_9HEXA
MSEYSEKTIDCNKLCLVKCEEFEADKPEGLKCAAEVAYCRCKRFYETPVFWILTILLMTIGCVGFRYIMAKVRRRRRRQRAGARTVVGHFSDPVMLTPVKDSDSLTYSMQLSPHHPITIATRSKDKVQRKITIVLTPSYSDNDVKGNVNSL